MGVSHEEETLALDAAELTGESFLTEQPSVVSHPLLVYTPRQFTCGGLHSDDLAGAVQARRSGFQELQKSLQVSLLRWISVCHLK